MTGRVRPFAPPDASSVISLHGRTLLAGSEQTPTVREFVRNFYEQVLFKHPWADEGLSSLVYERADGKIVGFLGVLPRPMAFRGRPIRVALATRFMVDPDEHHGPLAATALFTRFLRGPQHLALTDVANEQSRRIWQASRGLVVAASSLWWSSPTTPPIVDDPPETSGRSMDTAELLQCIELASRDCALRPVYDEKSLTWMLGHLEGARHRGSLHRRVVIDRNGDRAGWYVYYSNAGGYNGVHQIGSFRGASHLVLQDLLRHASLAEGSAQTRGRLDLPFADAVRAQRCDLSLGPWTLAHSRDRDLLLALTSGDSFFTRLDGEF